MALICPPLKAHLCGRVSSGKLLRIEHGGPGGLEVLVQHDGYVSVYSHLASVAPLLGEGLILAGDEVGTVGHTGVSFQPRYLGIY